MRVVYFEQNRESLEPTLTLKRALAPEGDSVIYRDRSLHVASWAKRFLFRPEQLETSVPDVSLLERCVGIDSWQKARQAFRTGLSKRK